MATNTKFQMRHDTAANWETKNPILAEGEQGYDTTNNYLKIGDGVTAWSDLPISNTILKQYASEAAAIAGTAGKLNVIGWW
jgi:hypothetical protein